MKHRKLAFISLCLITIPLFFGFWWRPKPIAPAIPATAIAENVFMVPTGRICMAGYEFHELSDTVFGTFTGQGVYNEYVVTVSGYGGKDLFRVSASIVNYQKGDKLIVEVAGDVTTSWYYHVDTPVYRLPNGIYTVRIGFLSGADATLKYRINMG